MTTTGTITGKDTNPFSEGHETKPYLGERKTEVLGEKKHRISQGNGRESHPTAIDRAESRLPESQRRHGHGLWPNQSAVGIPLI